MRKKSIAPASTEALLAGLMTAVNEQFSEGSGNDYSIYQDNPVGFAEEILNETLTNDIKCMMKSVRDHPVTVCVTANAVGKTHGAARAALWWLLCFADSQCYTAAAPPESNLRRLLWGEINSVVEKHPNIFAGVDKKTLQISKSTNSFLTGVAIPATGTSAQREARFSGKHAPHLLFVLDEGDAIDDAVYKGIESCLSGGHGRLLVMFNPRAEQGAPYRMIRDRIAHVVELSAFTHPNVVTGANIIPGAVDRETTARRINQWTRPLNSNEQADNTCFELPSFLEGCTATDQAGIPFPPLQPGQYKVVEPAFSYMVLGRYPAQGSTQLISREWLDKARSRWDAYVAKNGEVPPSGTSAVMGLDIGEYGSDLSCACFRYGGYTEKFITWGGCDTLVTANRAVEEYRSRQVRVCNTDATGLGAGVAPQMISNGCRANSVKVASSPTETTNLGEFRNIRSQLWWSCREWLRADTGAMLPPDDELLEELTIPTYEVINGKLEIMRKPTMRQMLGHSPDKADSLCLSFYQPKLLFPNL